MEKYAYITFRINRNNFVSRLGGNADAVDLSGLQQYMRTLPEAQGLKYRLVRVYGPTWGYSLKADSSYERSVMLSIEQQNMSENELKDSVYALAYAITNLYPMFFHSALLKFEGKEAIKYEGPKANSCPPEKQLHAVPNQTTGSKPSRYKQRHYAAAAH